MKGYEESNLLIMKIASEILIPHSLRQKKNLISPKPSIAAKLCRCCFGKVRFGMFGTLEEWEKTINNFDLSLRSFTDENDSDSGHIHGEIFNCKGASSRA